MRRLGPWPLVVAVVAALVVGWVVRGTPGWAVRTEDGQYVGDLDSYVDWTRLVTVGGIQAAYQGTWPETYAIYPPVTLYGFLVVGDLYRAAVDPSFDPDAARGSAWLRHRLKFEALVWQLLTAGAIYALVRRLGRPGLAGAAGALYALDPAILYDAAHWGQPDGAHSLFTVLAVGWLTAGLPLLAWSALALAALAKPQAWAILPLLVVATWRLRGAGGLARSPGAWGALARGALMAALTSLVVIAPFLLTGTLGTLLTLPGTIASVLPVATADAHNLWWLVLALRGAEPLQTPDSAPLLGASTPLLGPLSYRLVAAALVLAQLAFATWLFWSRRVSLAEAAALGVLGWFLFTTQAHENHLVLALPLLALAWPGRPGLLVPYAVLSLTVLLNMALHDQPVLEALGFGLDDPLVTTLRVLNAAANVACFGAWSLVAALRRPASGVPTRPPGRAGCPTEPSAAPAGPAVAPAPAGRTGSEPAAAASGAASRRSG
jgi:hypothetical protein